MARASAARGSVASSGRVRLGTSGFVYRSWRTLLYDGVPARAWLARYAELFDTVELNGTFYRLPTEAAVDRWREQVPPGFTFAAKGSRFLTHMKRLTDVEEGLARYFSRVGRLGRALGPVLWQLPPQMNRVDLPRLARFLAALPRTVGESGAEAPRGHASHAIRHVVEFRADAWHTDEVAALLDEHGVALCEHDLVSAPVPRPTGGFRYVRFHGATGKYHGRYGVRALAPVAEGARAWSRRHGDVYIYFNNDEQGHALYDALDMAELLGAPIDREQISLPAI